MGTKIYLGFQTLVWLGYGTYLIFQPGYLTEVSTLVAATPTAITEIRAMYGGLEAALGVAALLGILKPGMTRHALWVLLFATAGLATGRCIGLALDGDPTLYTLGALAFEGPSTVVTALLLRSSYRADAS